MIFYKCLTATRVLVGPAISFCSAAAFFTTSKKNPTFHISHLVPTQESGVEDSASEYSDTDSAADSEDETESTVDPTIDLPSPVLLQNRRRRNPGPPVRFRKTIAPDPSPMSRLPLRVEGQTPATTAPASGALRLSGRLRKLRRLRAGKPRLLFPDGLVRPLNLRRPRNPSHLQRLRAGTPGLLDPHGLARPWQLR